MPGKVPYRMVISTPYPVLAPIVSSPGGILTSVYLECFFTFIKITYRWQYRQKCGDDCYNEANEEKAHFEACFVVGKSPEYPTGPVENILYNCNCGVEMIVINECESECLAVGGHQAIAETNGKESSPYLENSTILKVLTMLITKLL